MEIELVRTISLESKSNKGFDVLTYLRRVCLVLDPNLGNLDFEDAEAEGNA